MEENETCTCGTPGKANWHVNVIWSRICFPAGVTDEKAFARWQYGNGMNRGELERRYGTETGYCDAYVCDEHKGKASDYLPDDGHYWYVVESHFNKLR